MVSESPNVVERSVRPTIPIQEGTFLLYPENQKFLLGESKQLTAINWVNRHIIVELVFRYLTLFLFIAVMMPLISMQQPFDYWLVLMVLVVVPVVVGAGFLLENLFNRFMNWRTTERYYREGQLLPGVLESCARGPLWTMDGSKLKFVYTFTNPSGKTIRGELGERYRTFGRRPVPEAGTPLVVLYFGDADNYLL